MSFEMRNINERPMIQKSQGLLKDGGGGGNLGYFQGRRRNQDEESSGSIFDNEIEDEFVLSDKASELLENIEKEKESNKGEESIVTKGMNFLGNLFRN